MATRQYAKHFLPLESNPEVFTELIHKLGVSTSLKFVDVFSLNEPELLPASPLAYILLFPTSETYETESATQRASSEQYAESGEIEGIIWFKQTIHNACGLYAILHAVCNVDRNLIMPDTLLSNFIESCAPLKLEERAHVLEKSEEFESVYKTAALQGDSVVPESAEDEVYFHFICFTTSQKNHHLYELNGDLNGPVDTGVLDGDVLCEASLRVVREAIKREMEKADCENFGLMALCVQDYN